MKKPLPPAETMPCVAVVKNGNALFRKNFDAAHNVVLLPAAGARELKGDFNGLARLLWNKEGRPGNHCEFAPEEARRRLSFADTFAKEAARILADMRVVREGGLDPWLRLVPPEGYDGRPPGFFSPLREGLLSPNFPLRGGVRLFHADGGDRKLGRALCCYNGTATEGLPPGAARPFLASPGVRRRIALLADGDGLIAKALGLKAAACFFPARGARLFAFRPGDIWRQATVNGPAGVPPFVHRAPPAAPEGGPPRLILVGNVPRASGGKW